MKCGMGDDSEWWSVTGLSLVNLSGANQSRGLGLAGLFLSWCLVGVLSFLEHALNPDFVEFGQTILFNEVVEAKLVGPHPNDLKRIFSSRIERQQDAKSSLSYEADTESCIEVGHTPVRQVGRGDF